MYYYEATVTDEGLCRVGWATDLAALDLGKMTKSLQKLWLILFLEIPIGSRSLIIQGTKE